jgi:hypothetical protein
MLRETDYPYIFFCLSTRYQDDLHFLNIMLDILTEMKFVEQIRTNATTKN